MEEPGTPAAMHDAVPLRDRAMATSGSYRIFLEQGTLRVHHILDPRTGKNAENRVVSVSVIARTCTLADGLATAFMVMGPEVPEGLLDELGAEVRVLFLLATAEGTIEQREFRW